MVKRKINFKMSKAQNAQKNFSNFYKGGSINNNNCLLLFGRKKRDNKNNQPWGKTVGLFKLLDKKYIYLFIYLFATLFSALFFADRFFYFFCPLFFQ